MTVIGILHPGDMGSALAAELRAAGHEVLWASDGRSEDTAKRAAQAGLRDAGSAGALARDSDVVLSVCPPHAAVEVATQVAANARTFVDANAISPATAREVAAIAGAGGARTVDASIIGMPPRDGDSTSLLLSGADAGDVAVLFDGTRVRARVLDGEIGAASAAKMAYAGWTKGSAALLLAVRALARAEGVEDALLAEWALSQPHLEQASQRAARSAAGKSWRWIGEMQEIAASMEAVGLPAGFHLAAAAIYERLAEEPDAELSAALQTLTQGP